MDEIDTRLIGILRRDARTPLSVLASKAGVSRGTVSNRLRKLEDDGVIAGYTLKLRPDADQDGLRAWMGITVDGNQTRAVLASLLGEPSVEQLRHQWPLGPVGRNPRRLYGPPVQGAGTRAPDQGHSLHRNQHPAGNVSLEAPPRPCITPARARLATGSAPRFFPRAAPAGTHACRGTSAPGGGTDSPNRPRRWPDRRARAGGQGCPPR